MLYQIMALSIRYLREWIHARRALIDHLSSVYAECGANIKKSLLLIIRRFLGFSYATTGHRLEEEKRIFSNFLSISEEREY